MRLVAFNAACPAQRDQPLRVPVIMNSRYGSDKHVHRTLHIYALRMANLCNKRTQRSFIRSTGTAVWNFQGGT